MRTILEISGNDREEFLQGLVTNDIRKLAQGPIYAALLTAQGKYLADFFLIRAGETILVDVDASLAPSLAQRLTMYRLRADVKIAPSLLQVSVGTGEVPSGAVVDPRHPAMGWRLYGETDGTDGTDFDAIRVAHCIPATGIELTPDTYILEAGFERLHGVDFRKGCYVGQEVTARMKHKTELRKGLARVSLSASVATGTPISRDGRDIGTLLTRSGNEAIAYLRLDRAGDDMTAGAAGVALIDQP
ncbi:YgfZ/GcvT domain-containing protein [Albirhodobacter sp. R86504]|uniref:CAF17-like 4Fe-4S cluster assembly/insertion protein YgfZ n=1 Tax=Albirhodobacter sp. R86504 TaxID=3093848 RepID=UPI00366A58E7